VFICVALEGIAPAVYARLDDWRLAERRHTDQQHPKIAEVFEDEQIELRPLGRPVDGYVEKLCGSDPSACCSMTAMATACRANMRGMTSRCTSMIIGLS